MSNKTRKTKCLVCGEQVDKISKGLCIKLFGEETKKYLCLECLANDLEVEESELIEKAKEFKDAGCKFFL